MRISLIQLNSGDNKEENFNKARDFILEAINKHTPDIISLSENFLYRGDNPDKENEKQCSKYISDFQELAKTHNTNLILGSILLATETPDKVTNTSIIINRQGAIIHRYHKMYMYDVSREDITYIESANTLPGNQHGTFELEGIKMGVGICVDLRYPEYFRELTKQGAEIIFLPANFRKKTGHMVWDILTKSRAIENQIFFCACGQTGGSEERERCGNTRIIAFDGQVVSEIGQEEGIVTAHLDLEALRKFRQEFPVLKQMR